MPTNPVEDESLDNDPTDELPVLLETAVLDPAEAFVPLAAADEETGEHTALYAVPPHEAESTASLESLRAELLARAAKIEALEADVGRLSSHCLDVERRLSEKDATIEELGAALTDTRATLEGRSTVEQRLSAEILDRDTQFNRVLDELERHRTENARQRTEIERLVRDQRLAAAELAAVREQLALEAARSADLDRETRLQALQEELATLSSYVANRRAWWDDLEARAAAYAARIAELEHEVTHRAERQHQAEQLAEREAERAAGYRSELAELGRRAEALDREVAEQRAAQAQPRTDVASLREELDRSNQLATQLQQELLIVTRQLAAERAAQARHEELRSAALELAETRLAETEQAAAALRAPPADSAFEVLAQLEVELEHKRHELVRLREEFDAQQKRYERTAAELERLRSQLTETRAELEQSRADRTRLEQQLADKDKASEARDERIAALQRELDHKLGALQQLNARDISLQSLDSRRSERLRAAEPADENTGTPALVCLTGDSPRQFALNKSTMTIGRSSSCDVQILTHFVSREHARLTIGRGGVMIEDLGSTNGVFVNSVRVERHELRHGDLVTVGETQFRFLTSMAH